MFRPVCGHSRTMNGRLCQLVRFYVFLIFDRHDSGNRDSGSRIMRALRLSPIVPPTSQKEAKKGQATSAPYPCGMGAQGSIRISLFAPTRKCRYLKCFRLAPEGFCLSLFGFRLERLATESDRKQKCVWMFLVLRLHRRESD